MHLPTFTSLLLLISLSFPTPNPKYSSSRDKSDHFSSEPYIVRIVLYVFVYPKRQLQKTSLSFFVLFLFSDIQVPAKEQREKSKEKTNRRKTKDERQDKRLKTEDKKSKDKRRKAKRNPRGQQTRPSKQR
jgi:hypothetical protein